MDGGSVLGLGTRAEGGTMTDRDAVETRGMSKVASILAIHLWNILLHRGCFDIEI